jgi:DNA-binding GntR family transcriptional regulator
MRQRANPSKRANPLKLVSAASNARSPQRADSTLAASALSKVMALISSGELPPGATINEKYLAERFSMSRGPVREAVRTLEGRKLVTRTAFKRARVIALDKIQIKEIFEFRQSLEATACRLATRLMTDQQLQELVAKFGAGPGASRRQPSNRRPFDFHQAIVEACGNSRIQAALGPDLYVLLSLYRRASQRAGEAGRTEGHWTPPNPPAQPSTSDHEHWQIARAMLARDEDLAESLIRAHIARAMGAILANSG